MSVVVFWVVTPYNLVITSVLAEHLDPSSTLKVEMMYSSKMLVIIYKTTQHQKTTFDIESSV
jgi:hypothetical protein